MKKVYLIRHNKTNRVYIGSSKEVDIRIRKHMSDLRHHRHPVEDMQEDFDRYGDDYTVTILEDSSKETRDEYEWQSIYRSYVRGKGYNYKDPRWKGQTASCEKNERELMETIMTSKNPTKAFVVAISIISAYLGVGDVIQHFSEAKCYTSY
jgi:hypothetical protein